MTGRITQIGIRGSGLITPDEPGERIPFAFDELLILVPDAIGALVNFDVGESLNKTRVARRVRRQISRTVK